MKIVDPDAPGPAAEPAVAVELRVNGRAVKGFPYRLFADKADLTPAAALRLVEAWQAERRQPQGG